MGTVDKSKAQLVCFLFRCFFLLLSCLKRNSTQQLFHRISKQMYWNGCSNNFKFMWNSCILKQRGCGLGGRVARNKEQYSLRLCACLPKDQSRCSALWPFRLMPLPPLPPAGNMTHFHSYKVRLDLGCWVLVAGEGQTFISCEACKILSLIDLQITDGRPWILFEEAANMMLLVKSANILSNEYHRLRSSNNQEGNHVPLGQFHPS